MKRRKIEAKQNYALLAWVVLGLVLIFPSMGFCFSAQAHVDKTRISVHDTVSFQVIVDGGKGQVDLAPITDFQVLSSGTQSSRSYVNGKFHHQVIYQYSLMPKKQGVLKIPELTVTREKEKTVTREIQILVSEEDLARDGVKSFYAEASLSSPDIVQGQQAVYTLKLYLAEKLYNVALTSLGFKDLMTRQAGEQKKYTRNINGRVFVVLEINYLVQGEALGEFTIAPAVFTAQKPVTPSRDSFDSFFNDSFFSGGRTSRVRAVSNPVTLKVIVLPQYSGTQDFSGLVGEFTISTGVDEHTLVVGESATLTITIEGKGNIMDAGVPPLKLDPKRFKVYEDSPEEQITATENGFSGKKIFKQALVPGIPGRVTIPSLGLTYFNTRTRAYKTIVTDPIPLVVEPSANPATLTDQKPESKTVASKQAVVMRNRDIFDIKEEISSISSAAYLPLPLFLMLLGLPGLGFVLCILGLRFKNREKTIQETYRARAQNYLGAAQKISPRSPEYLGLVQAALTAAVLSLGDKQGESLTREEAERILGQSSEDTDMNNKIMALMETLDSARFGGAAMDEKKAVHTFERVQRMIKTMAVMACFVLPLVSFSAQAHAQDRAGLFIDGTRAYKAGSFKEAAQCFETIASQGIKNSNLFYNLGNAYLKSNDIGRAILWYERALRLSPGDPDLNFNLNFARNQVTDKIERSFSPWTVLFFWQGVMPLKYFQFLSIGASLLFFAWAVIRKIRKKKVFSGPGIVLFVMLMVFCLATGLEAGRLNSQRCAVILGQTVSVRSGTHEAATQLFDLHAGTRVDVVDKKENHIKIRIGKEKVGWVSMDEAQII
ncbi:MAG: BatD family protein [Desulfobacter sp.]|nr:MAG: BatD family protein [Desulfobacter sp.]